MDKLSVLVADDDIQIIKTIMDFLEYFFPWLNVDSAPNGFKAIEMLNKNYYPLIITDYRMPLADGSEVVEAAREKYGERVKILMMSGYGFPQEALLCNMVSGRNGSRYCIDAFLEKPFGMQDFIQAVRIFIKPENGENGAGYV